MIREEYKTTLVAFHVGRGGRFNAGGHNTYLAKVSDFFDLLTLRSEHLFWHEHDENGNPLPRNEWYIADAGGNLLLTYDEAQQRTGILDFDGEYNLDLVCSLYSCCKPQNEALLEAFRKGEISEYDPRYEVIKQYLIDYMELDDNESDDEDA